MPTYSAGDLSININAVSGKATKSIEVVVKRLQNLQTAINQLDTGRLSTQMSQMSTALAGFTKENLSNIKLSSLSTKITNFSKKMANIDWTTVQKGFNNLTVAITPFIDKVVSAESALRALSETMKVVNGRKLKGLANWNGTVGGATRTSGSSSSKGVGFLGFRAGFGKLLVSYYTLRRIGTVFADIAQSGADYTETLNLWETAMSGNLNTATKFVNKMNEAYGISERTLMNAQATFKNMLGSLGQISEGVAYQLSEGITQMAIDYASLYNVTFEKAFEKFQSALAGQVRPIRSVSGYDITENTIYELYKQLGGTKSVRNLSRTEKQLLGILAIFNQMTASGAIGDLDKTIESYANQSRIMAEAWKDFASYVGIVLTYFIQNTGIIVYISATLMYLTDMLKSIANELNAIQSFGGDIFGDTTESIYGMSDALDEANGKLLDFDKFRALSGGDENVAIDEKLLEGLTRYESILENAKNSAREMANAWKEMGSSNILIETFNAIYKLFDRISNNTKITSFFVSLKLSLEPLFEFLAKDLDTVVDLIINVLSFIASIYPIIEPLLDIVLGLFDIISSIVKVVSTSFETLSSWVHLWAFLGEILSWVGKITYVLLELISALVETLSYISLFRFDKLGEVWSRFGSNVSSKWGESNGIGFFANGGLPDKGTMFIAGEAGAEMVYNTSSGQSGVANIQQIKQAMLGAMIEYGKTQSSSQPIQVYLDGELVYKNTTKHAKQRGQVWGTV